MRRQLIRIGSVSLLLAPFVCAEARTVTVTGTDSEAIAAARSVPEWLAASVWSR